MAWLPHCFFLSCHVTLFEFEALFYNHFLLRNRGLSKKKKTWHKKDSIFSKSCYYEAITEQNYAESLESDGPYRMNNGHSGCALCLEALEVILTTMYWCISGASVVYLIRVLQFFFYYQNFPLHCSSEAFKCSQAMWRSVGVTIGSLITSLITALVAHLFSLKSPACIEYFFLSR